MATPEQSLPGDELTDNVPGEPPVGERRKNISGDRRSSNSSRLGSINSQNANTHRNPNWYDTVDTDFNQLQHNRKPPTRNNHSHNYEDLPPDDINSLDVDSFHDDVASEYDQWKDFQVTDRVALTAREIDNLTDEEKLKRAQAILEYNRRRQQNSRDNEKSFKHEKAKGWFALQMFIGYGISSLFMIFIVVFTGLFIYTTFKDGTLNDNGIGVGILNTIQEVLRIIFSPGPGDAF